MTEHVVTVLFRVKERYELKVKRECTVAGATPGGPLDDGKRAPAEFKYFFTWDELWIHTGKHGEVYISSDLPDGHVRCKFGERLGFYRFVQEEDRWFIELLEQVRD